MANEDQLEILKQSVEVWNKWRVENLDVHIDLSNADLKDLHLRNVNLNGAKLDGADLTHSNLEEARLIKATFRNARLIAANLRKSDLWGVDFDFAFLKEVNLSETRLRGINLSNIRPTDDDLAMSDLSKTLLRKADLSYMEFRNFSFDGADLREAKLDGTEINNTTLIGADLSRVSLVGATLKFTDARKASFFEAIMNTTDLSRINFSEAKGLESVIHEGPSLVGLDTIYYGKGLLPDAFLRGCGLSDADIEYAKLSNPDLSNEQINNILYKIYDLRAHQALQIFPLFISYSHGDNKFVDKIGTSLARIGVRYWRDIHDMKSGRIEKQIDRAIRQNPAVLLVLSKNSLSSDWVEHEVRTARELEKEMGRDVLCPVALDDSWKDSKWDKHLMGQVMKYNILDFSAWKDDSKFDGMFHKLIDGLELFYKG